MVLRFTFCCFVILTFLYGTAQHPYFFSINDENTLPSNEVYDLFQDNFGFMWLGTNTGLYRYDGTDFTLISSSAHKGMAISHLKQDKAGKLWCQNFSGHIYSVSGDSLKLEYDWSGKKANFPVFEFDADNQLWVTSDRGIYMVNSTTKATFFDITTRSPSPYEASIPDLFNYGSRLFFANRNVVGYVEGSKVEVLRAVSHPALLCDHSTSISFHEVNGQLYALSRSQQQNSVWLIKNDSMVWLRNLPKTPGRIYSLHNTGNKQLWVGGSSGVLCLDTHLNVQFDGLLLFPGKSVSKVLLDKEGNYWFSTLQDGIFVIPSIEVCIYTKDNSPLSDSHIRQLTKDNQGNLFIGYHNGKLSRYQWRSKAITTIHFPNSLTDIQVLYSDTCTHQIIVGQNKTWLVDTRTMKATYVQGISNIKAITKEKDKSFLAGTVMGSFICQIYQKAAIKAYLRNKRTRAVLYDHQTHNRWVAYADGLWLSNSQTQREIKFQNQTLYVTDIAQGTDGTIWIATLDNGVLGFTDTTCVIQILKDIPKGVVRKIAVEGNAVWIAVEDKLICYDRAGKSSQSYNRLDGLQSMEISDIEFIDDKVIIATSKGLVEIPRDFNSKNTVPPPVFITAFAVNEKAIVKSNQYHLNYSENSIRISFKGIAFRSQGQFTYKYRLLGLDTTWVVTNSGSNSARFQSLPAGKYLFEVKAQNEDGTESETPATISITVLKPFWQKWWFYTACAATLVSMVSFAFMLRIREIRKRSELEKRMAYSQLSVLKSQMNPHFMFNALNSIQDLVLQQDTTNAQLYLGKFSELTRQVLEASGAEFISLQKETEMLSLYLDLEKLRFGDEMRYSINMDTNLDADEIQIPALIIQPFVENALKHGLLHKHGEKLLKICFAEKENTLVCTIDDNGIGRTAAEKINARKQKHKSFATEAITERLHLLNEFYQYKIGLEVIDKPEGTKILLRIPMKEKIKIHESNNC